MHAIEKQTLKEMTIDALWELHESIVAILASRLEAEKSELEARLCRLRGDTKAVVETESSRRPYPAVSQRFRNPAAPHQTWSGRGKRPHWVTELLNTGTSIQDLQISDMAGSSS